MSDNSGELHWNLRNIPEEINCITIISVIAPKLTSFYFSKSLFSSILKGSKRTPALESELKSILFINLP